jgi:hypothetical protein
MKWRVWFKPKWEVLMMVDYGADLDFGFLRGLYSEVIDAERAFVDPYAKTLSFLPKSENVVLAEGEKKRKGPPKKAPVHALRVFAPDVWKEFEQEPDQS